MGLEIVEEYRGISVATLEECGVWWKHSDNYPVQFPYYHKQGTWYTRMGIDPSGEPRQPKILSPANAEKHLYNPLVLGPNSPFIILCEGEYDTLSVIDAGFPAMGTQGTGAFMAPWARLFTGALTVVMFDSDSAGIAAASKFRKWHKDAGGQCHIKTGVDGVDLNDLHKDDSLADYIEEFLDAEGIAVE